MTLSAAPSLETLHGTHGTETEHERRGGQSVRHNDTCTKKTKQVSLEGMVRRASAHPKHVLQEVRLGCVRAPNASRGCNHLGMAGTRLPFSSIKWPPALRTQRWWRDMRACLAVVGVSFPFCVSAFFNGENSSSRNTSYTTNILMDQHSGTHVISRDFRGERDRHLLADVRSKNRILI